ncbi:MAG: DUF4202 family protein [Kofleriaceae bacterium]
MVLAIQHDPSAVLTPARWQSDDFDFWAFDRAIDDLVANARPLKVADPEGSTIAQIAIRARRLADARNAGSRASWFDRVLAAHRALHELDKPLVRADFDHAVDSWQWTLVLDVEVTAAVQLAALLHDIERLRSEPDVRIEHHAADYQAFKIAHARAGAVVARELLAIAGVPRAIVDEACALVAHHEQRGPRPDPSVAAINDADALSFFSLNSPGYLAYFGAAQTARKVSYTLARMSPEARAWLPRLRLPRGIDVEIERWHGDHRA